MFERGEKVELNVCLGEERFGIMQSEWERMCRNRVGKYMEKHNPSGSYAPKLVHEVRCCSGNWKLPEYGVKKCLT